MKWHGDDREIEALAREIAREQGVTLDEARRLAREQTATLRETAARWDLFALWGRSKRPPTA